MSDYERYKTWFKKELEFDNVSYKFDKSVYSFPRGPSVPGLLIPLIGKLRAAVKQDETAVCKALPIENVLHDLVFLLRVDPNGINAIVPAKGFDQ